MLWPSGRATAATGAGGLWISRASSERRDRTGPGGGAPPGRGRAAAPPGAAESRCKNARLGVREQPREGAANGGAAAPPRSADDDEVALGLVTLAGFHVVHVDPRRDV